MYLFTTRQRGASFALHGNVEVSLCLAVHKEGGEREERNVLFQVTVFAAAVRREVRAQISLHLRRERRVAGVGPDGCRGADVDSYSLYQVPDMAVGAKCSAPMGLGGDEAMPSLV